MRTWDGEGDVARGVRVRDEVGMGRGWQTSRKASSTPGPDLGLSGPGKGPDMIARLGPGELVELARGEVLPPVVVDASCCHKELLELLPRRVTAVRFDELGRRVRRGAEAEVLALEPRVRDVR